MDDLLKLYANDPKNGRLNFMLAIEYHKLRHYAGACSYYLRCAEWSEIDQEKEIIYESLMQISLCFRFLGNRNWTEEGWLLHAVSLDPTRPEAYWLLSQIYERTKKWQESYMMASIGMSCAGNAKPLINGIGFEGAYVIEFQKMVAAWWVPKIAECREILFSMPDRWPQMSEHYVRLVQNNMSTVGVGRRAFRYYKPSDRIRQTFPGIENIQSNYSQVFQDLFVLTMLQGKRNGYYLEIGASDPVHISNTWLLESKFAWNGVSIEIREDMAREFNRSRRNPCFCRDALGINYERFLMDNNAPMDIDYLQIDCEPPETSWRILCSIPFDKYRFAVITFEHDYYADATRSFKAKSRKLLKSYGYKLVVNNISPEETHDFEDWWCHPALVSSKLLTKMTSLSDEVQVAYNYIINK
jgi:hypothetical protein